VPTIRKYRSADPSTQISANALADSLTRHSSNTGQPYVFVGSWLPLSVMQAYAWLLSVGQAFHFVSAFNRHKALVESHKALIEAARARPAHKAFHLGLDKPPVAALLRRTIDSIDPTARADAAFNLRGVATLGEFIFEELPDALKNSNRNRYIAINVATHEYLIEDSGDQVMDRYSAHFGESPAYVRRIGALDSAGALRV